MYTPEEHFVMNLADIYSLLFGYIYLRKRTDLTLL